MTDRLINSVFDLGTDNLGATNTHDQFQGKGTVYRPLDRPSAKQMHFAYVAAAAEPSSKGRDEDAGRSLIEEHLEKFKFTPAPKAEQNPYRDQLRVNVAEFKDFFNAQDLRTHIGAESIWPLVPKNICTLYTINSLKEDLKATSKAKTMPGIMAAAIWDAYSTIPSWDQPVDSEEAHNHEAFDRVRLLMDTDVAEAQIAAARKLAKAKISDITSAMSGLNIPVKAVEKILYKNTKSVPRQHVAYVLAYLLSDEELTPLAKEPKGRASLTANVIPSLK